MENHDHRPAIPQSGIDRRLRAAAAPPVAETFIVVTVLTGREGVLHFLHPEPVAQGTGPVPGLVAPGANASSVLLPRPHGKYDVNVRGICRQPGRAFP